MTCIVGLVDSKRGRVIIGADSLGVDSHSFKKVVRKDRKVFRCGDFIIGCTSSYRMIDILKYKFTPPPPPLLDSDIHKYMCTDFIDEVRKVFKKSGFLKVENTFEEEGGSFLVGYKNKLFYIQGDFQVGESFSGFDSCGCGDSFANGSLYTTSKMKMSAKKRVKLALESAESLSAGVQRPFVLLETN